MVIRDNVEGETVLLTGSKINPTSQAKDLKIILVSFYYFSLQN